MSESTLEVLREPLWSFVVLVTIAETARYVALAATTLGRLRMMGLLQELVATQCEIYLAFADRIGNFAETGEWQLLAAMLPLAIVFGMAHALTPGHSKAVLATYLTGSTATLPRALVVSLALSFTHVTMSVLIALFSLPLVSVALGSVGRAPLLEDLSRGLLGLIGL